MLDSSKSPNQIESFSAILRIADVLASKVFSAEGELLHFIYTQIKKIIELDGIFIALYDEENYIIRFPLAYDRDIEVQLPTLKYGEGLTGYIIEKGMPLLISKADNVAPWLGVPMRRENKIIGVIATYRSKNDNIFNEDDLQILSIIANLTAFAIYYSKLSVQFARKEEEYVNRERTYTAEIKRLTEQKIEYDSRPFSQENTKTIFISYAREDIEAARKIYQELRESGFNPWLDKERLIPGHKWKDEIIKAIRNSQSFIALLSANSTSKKGFVQKELKEALEVLELYPDSAIYLIPVRLDNCEISHRVLKDLQWVDMFPNWDYGFNKIRAALHTINYT